jgi:hypothetical protein
VAVVEPVHQRVALGVLVAVGAKDHRVVPVQELDAALIERVFDGPHVRTPDEQRAWEARRTDMLPGNQEAPEADFHVCGKYLVVRRAVRIPLSTLKRLV